ncbi:MAG: hypothetical protein JST86_11095 [Bacteroidetes bacterium]|nr:hypothetical protein [Bacteroidota bacterium]
MKKILIIVCSICILQHVTAQKKLIHFASYTSAGFVTGKSPVAFAAQTENGISVKNWFAGIGIGYDKYNYKTIPVYAALKKSFSFKPVQLFLYANAGTHYLAEEHEWKTPFSSTTIRGQCYGAAGVGCTIKTGKHTGIFFAVGNCIKKIHIVETGSIQPPDALWMYDTVRSYSRIECKAGFCF